MFQLQGSQDAKAETLLNYEAGYRNQIRKRLSLDVTAFRSQYGRLSTFETGAPYSALPVAFIHRISLERD